jgi:hypothetical protein
MRAPEQVDFEGELGLSLRVGLCEFTDLSSKNSFRDDVCSGYGYC